MSDRAVRSLISCVRRICTTFLIESSLDHIHVHPSHWPMGICTWMVEEFVRETWKLQYELAPAARFGVDPRACYRAAFRRAGYQEGERRGAMIFDREPTR